MFTQNFCLWPLQLTEDKLVKNVLNNILVVCNVLLPVQQLQLHSHGVDEEDTAKYNSNGK